MVPASPTGSQIVIPAGTIAAGEYFVTAKLIETSSGAIIETLTTSLFIVEVTGFGVKVEDDYGNWVTIPDTEALLTGQRAQWTATFAPTNAPIASGCGRCPSGPNTNCH